jgi:hypothetical protein
MSADPRSHAQRRRDTEHRLTHHKEQPLTCDSAPDSENSVSRPRERRFAEPESRNSEVGRLVVSDRWRS